MLWPNVYHILLTPKQAHQLRIHLAYWPRYKNQSAMVCVIWSVRYQPTISIYIVP